MEIKPFLKEAILRQLNEKYPSGEISSADKLLPEHTNREEIIGHITHFINNEWVTASPIEEEAMASPVDYKFIKLTSKGKNYFDANFPK